MQMGSVTASGRHHLSNATALRSLIGAWGVIWLLNAAFQAEAWLVAPPAEANFAIALARPAAQAPVWLKPILLGVLHGVQTIGPSVVAAVMVAIAVLLGLTMLTRVALKLAAGLGVVYSLICWIVLDGLGFPYAHGQTDPGVFVAYAIAFLFVLAAASSLDRADDREGMGTAALWNGAQLAFGLLWLFDAGLKWLPAFLFHFTSQITSVVPGQPQWIAIWLGFVATVIVAIGPVAVAVLIAIAETVIAAGLLTGRGLKIILPFGLVYALAVWATAEAFGGPYTQAGTGVRGNVLGNVLVYIVPFLFLWLRRRSQQHDAGATPQSAPAQIGFGKACLPSP